MCIRLGMRIIWVLILVGTGILSGALLAGTGPVDTTGSQAVFNVRDFGASGKKAENCQKAIQAAIEACAAAGGGQVYFPPGEYSTGTIHLRSHVRIYLEAGANVYSIKDQATFDKEALFYGEDLVNITLEGRGVINGQAEYEWREKGDFHDDFIYPNQLEMEKIGRPLIRSFPRANQYGKLVLLLRCRDVLIRGLSFIDSPSWTIHPYGCERLTIDGVYIRSSLKEGVWADGIDPDGCRDVRIVNSTIETGDDALVFYSINWFGPALPCENITVTNCRLSSASSAIKFCDGNMNAIRKMTIDNCVVTDSNRGLSFMVFDGGVVEDVVISNLVIETRRHDWFWWGDGEPIHFNVKKRSEVHRNWKKEDDRPAGKIRRVLIKNVVARGQGSSQITGHAESRLEDVTIENLRLAISHNADSFYDKAVNALEIKLANNFRMRNVDIIWEGPVYEGWQNAVYAENVRELEVDGLMARQAREGDLKSATLVLNQVGRAIIRNCQVAPGTGVFLKLLGSKTRDIFLGENELSRALKPLEIGVGVMVKKLKKLDH
ncbi:MAG: glycoside hydrolase family 28 protein [Candidatus Saccharicenans sp.]|uniref:glycoside hydrolase family 28 protein n=1 Tax=Candidatus Saccharicenans sp. TaxID=2819258 RepID=UPI0040493212